LAALVAARSHLSLENLPGTDAASRKYGMDQLAEVGFFPWPEYSGLSCDRFERLDQPVEWAMRVLEAIDQDRASPGKAASSQLGAIGDRASVFGVRREDLLDGCVFVGAVVAPQAGELDLDSPVRGCANRKVTDVAVAWVASFPRSRVDARVCCLHLCQSHGHRGVLAEWSDPGLVEPRGVAVAGGLWALVVNDLHRQGEVAHDLTKIHGSKTTALGQARSPNPRIKRRAHRLSKPSESVRFFGLAGMAWSGSSVLVRGRVLALLLRLLLTEHSPGPLVPSPPGWHRRPLTPRHGQGSGRVWRSLAESRSPPQMPDTVVACPAESVGSGSPCWLPQQVYHQLGGSVVHQPGQPGLTLLVIPGASARE
jgi:hypothetical protein